MSFSQEYCDSTSNSVRCNGDPCPRTENCMSDRCLVFSFFDVAICVDHGYTCQDWYQSDYPFVHGFLDIVADCEGVEYGEREECDALIEDCIIEEHQSSCSKDYTLFFNLCEDVLCTSDFYCQTDYCDYETFRCKKFDEDNCFSTRSDGARCQRFPCTSSSDCYGYECNTFSNVCEVTMEDLTEDEYQEFFAVADEIAAVDYEPD